MKILLLVRIKGLNVGNKNIYILFMLFIKYFALKNETCESSLLQNYLLFMSLIFLFVNKCLLIYYQTMTFKICYFLQLIWNSGCLFTMDVQTFEKESKFKILIHETIYHNYCMFKFWQFMLQCWIVVGWQRQ
jgi:hypothetical protein